MLPLIVALATPVGYSAIAVVRATGAGLPAAMRAICGRVPADRRATLVRVRDAEGVFDDAVATVFFGPRSYTGEDVAELACHGNPMLAERLVGAFIAAGARLASPGEFTRRALLNGRIDAIGAEAVLATIRATSPAGLALAREAPALRARVDELRARLVDVAAELEAILDYPGEDLLFSTDDAIAGGLRVIAAEATGLAAGWRAGAVALDGARVALVGRVNAGKSSLLNALLGRERAIVSATPGTTRDVVEAPLLLPSGRILLLDTAGERRPPPAVGVPAAAEPDGDEHDAIEAAGLSLGRAAAAAADLRLWCTRVDEPPGLPPARPYLHVATQIDRAPARFPHDHAVSATTGDGVDALRNALLPGLVGVTSGAEALVTSARQRDVLLAIAAAATAAADALPIAGPAIAVTELTAAIRHADVLTGRDTGEDVLDRLFARFCVGK